MFDTLYEICTRRSHISEAEQSFLQDAFIDYMRENKDDINYESFYHLITRTKCRTSYLWETLYILFIENANISKWLVNRINSFNFASRDSYLRAICLTMERGAPENIEELFEIRSFVSNRYDMEEVWAHDTRGLLTLTYSGFIRVRRQYIVRFQSSLLCRKHMRDIVPNLVAAMTIALSGLEAFTEYVRTFPDDIQNYIFCRTEAKRDSRLWKPEGNEDAVDLSVFRLMYAMLTDDVYEIKNIYYAYKLRSKDYMYDISIVKGILHLCSSTVLYTIHEYYPRAMTDNERMHRRDLIDFAEVFKQDRVDIFSRHVDDFLECDNCTILLLDGIGEKIFKYIWDNASGEGTAFHRFDIKPNNLFVDFGAGSDPIRLDSARSLLRGCAFMLALRSNNPSLLDIVFSSNAMRDPEMIYFIPLDCPYETYKKLDEHSMTPSIKQWSVLCDRVAVAKEGYVTWILMDHLDDVASHPERKWSNKVYRKLVANGMSEHAWPNYLKERVAWWAL